MRNSAPAMANRALPGPVDYPQIPELAQRGVARVQRFFVTLNERLAGRDFVATDRFSVADISAAVAVDFARVVKVKPERAAPAPAALACGDRAAAFDGALIALPGDAR